MANVFARDDSARAGLNRIVGARPAQPFRLEHGGLIDRSQPLSFTFDGRAYQGYEGDSLASALLASGVRVVARSFKYHRRRGVISAGPEEPNALVTLRRGARREPNTRATMVELFEGLEATSQNRWPSLTFDLNALNGLFGPLIPAGFYYKTFMGRAPSTRLWMFAERFIRRAAGMGTASLEPDPDRYDKRSLHADVLVIGGGPAGIAAASAAAESGARTVLMDEGPRFGGALLHERFEIGGAFAGHWVTSALDTLHAAGDRVVLLPRTTAFGYYDHDTVGAIERVQDHVPEPDPRRPRQRLWTIRAKRVVLATGAIEQPLLFADNDRPGVMLAAAARAYVNRYGVAPGRRAVIAAGHDEAYRTALDLADAGVEIAAVVDTRAGILSPLVDAVRRRGIEVLEDSVVIRALGGRTVEAAEIAGTDDVAGGRARQRLECDLIATSGGWSPAIHLSSQTGARPVYDEKLGAFLPGEARWNERPAGAVRGLSPLRDCLEDGFRAGAAAAHDIGYGSGTAPSAPPVEDAVEGPARRFWVIAPSRGKAFVDLQDDVTTDDVELAHREGFVSVEHLKRYTTLGMGTDQGKTSNLAGAAIMAGLRSVPLPEAGTTTFRPPTTPVAFGALAGREVGQHFRPLRRTPMDRWHAQAGAVWIDAGLWRRPRAYPRPGESMLDAAYREAAKVRETVGLVDVTTLGKIDVQGPDACTFLDRLYTGTMSGLPVGKAKYGLMLREDGLVMDDGTCARIGETRFHVTTTTAHAIPVMQHLEHHLQVVWPELRCEVASVTEQWAAMAVSGPRSRDLLAAVVHGEVTKDALPHMGVRDMTIDRVPVRLFRMSFSGELAYEVHTPAGFGLQIWERLIEAGEHFDLTVYGVEALGVLRIEKGHVAGGELDGRTTPDDLGLVRMVKKKSDFVGRHMLKRPALTDPERQRLVGLIPKDRRSGIRIGAQVIEDAGALPPVAMLGHVTSTTWSPALGHPIALALVSRGLERAGETLHAAFPLRDECVPVEVVSPVFFDPEGTRLHA